MVLLALLIAFRALTVLRAVIVWRRAGFNPFGRKLAGQPRPSVFRLPLVMRRTDPVHGVLDCVLEASLACLFGIALVYAFAPGWKPWLAPISYLETAGLRTAGAVLAALAIPWIGVAQFQMVKLRLGRPRTGRAGLLDSGPFSISRNPIYLGILAAFSGFFLQAPNAPGFGVVVAALVAFTVTIRHEEGYLLTQHGAAYLDYCVRVRRWIGHRRQPPRPLS